MPDLEAKFTGLKQLDEALQSLPDKLQRNVLRAALRAGGKPIADEAKRLVPVDSGRLQKSIKVTSRLVQGTPTAKVSVGGRKKGQPFYAHLIEFGTAAHAIMAREGTKSLFINGVAVGKYVEHPGAKAKPFMRPAMDSQARTAVERFSEVVRSRLTKQGIEIPDPVPEDNE